VIVGVNRIFPHGGVEYHLQAEDLGLEQSCFEVRVYEKGSVLFQKRVPYAETLVKTLPKLELEEAVRSQMEKTLQTVQAAIAKGKLGA
jgi:hypothetical protein